MSSFYGIWRRDGQAVTEAEAAKMQEAFDWWKPDESDCVLQGNLLIGQATLWNTPESKHEHLPVKRGHYILAMDARIDNREALAAELDLPDRPMEQIGDSEFVLAAYEKWGEACADRLLGDFAFVIWDEKNQQLFCARDFIGVRPFYYYVDEEKFVFGSDMESLVKSDNLPTEIRDESVANFFVNGQLTDTKHTFLQHIDRLEGGCTLTLTKEGLSTNRYWHPNNVKKIHLPSKEAYIKEIRSLLEDAVRVRLRTSYPVASHLSGGLDSSPIAILASREIRKTQPAYRLPVYSWQPTPKEDDDLSHFEWAYAIDVAKQEDVQLRFSDLNAKKMIEGMKTHNLFYDKGSQLWYEIDIRQALQQKGARTMLSGWGGDEFITNHGYAFYTQMLLQGRWKRFYKSLKHRIQKRNMTPKQIIGFLYKMVFIPILPTKLYCYMPKIKCQEPDWSIYDKSFVPLVQSAYKQKTHIFSRYTSASIKADIIRAWTNGHVQGRLNCWSQEALESKLSYTFPLLDRRLVELSFSLPTKWMISEGEDRYLYRKAVENLLPAAQLWGIHKSEQKRWSHIQKIVEETLGSLKTKDFGNNDYIAKKRENFEWDLNILYFLLAVDK